MKLKIDHTKILLCFFILTHLFLSIYGNTWGLPSRWNSDEKIANVLHMAHQKMLYDPNGFFFHPTGYHIFLLIAFIPVYLYLKIIQYPLLQLKEAASVSWIHMSHLFPDFSTGIYVYARTLSALLGALAVYLIYLLGKNLYDKNTGLFSSAFLSVCMGFVGVNHSAKYISLMNVLILTTVLLCLKALKNHSEKFLFCGFLCAGLATSTHINGPLLLLPLGLTIIFLYSNPFKSLYVHLKKFLLGIILYALGIFMGTPSLFTHFKNYYLIISRQYSGDLKTQFLFSLDSYIIKIPNYLLEILSICGIPLFSIIVMGFLTIINRWQKLSKYEIVVFSFPLAYILSISILYLNNVPHTKNIIAAIPLLMLFGGKMMTVYLASPKFCFYAKYVLFPAIFLFSFAYSFKADLIFKKEDPRYTSTQWIKENIPKNSQIEIFDQLDKMTSATLFHDYEFIFLGRSSRKFLGQHFFRWDKVENKNAYLAHLNTHDSSSDYIMISTYDLDRWLNAPQDKLSHLPGLTQYVKSLFESEKKYILIKVFELKNKRVYSKTIKGLIYPQNLLWDPIPGYEETCRTIYIFKRA